MVEIQVSHLVVLIFLNLSGISQALNSSEPPFEVKHLACLPRRGRTFSGRGLLLLLSAWRSKYSAPLVFHKLGEDKPHSPAVY